MEVNDAGERRRDDWWLFTGSCVREEKDAVVMFIILGAQCESINVEHWIGTRKRRFDEGTNGLNTSYLIAMESCFVLVDCTGKNWGSIGENDSNREVNLRAKPNVNESSHKLSFVRQRS